MREDIGELNVYRVELLHKNCWSSEISKDYVDTIVSLNLTPPSLRALRVCKARRSIIIETLHKNSFRKRYHITNFHINKLQSNLFLMEMEVPIAFTSVSKFLKSGINSFVQVVANNQETFYFISDSFKAKNLIKFLEKDSYIEILSIQRSKLNDVLAFVSSGALYYLAFTSKEKILINRALNKGYFDIPRKANLFDLSVELGISKTEVSALIRSAINKVIRSIMHIHHNK
jgi:predicted DNA binding protein